jgi:hypothetical protein
MESQEQASPEKKPQPENLYFEVQAYWGMIRVQDLQVTAYFVTF